MPRGNMSPLLEEPVAKTSVDKTSAYRSRLRTRGLRPLQLWVPDTRNPAVAESVGRQVRALRDHRSEAEIEPLLDAALADVDGWKG